MLDRQQMRQLKIEPSDQAVYKEGQINTIPSAAITISVIRE